jgi:8-amino-7-oxononanoate synthase
MSQLQRSIRHKRFSVKSVGSVTLTITNRSGDNLTFRVVDCSANGLRVQSEGKPADQDWCEINSIISNSKINWDEKEVSLGRLVIRRSSEVGDHYEYAFSTVDIDVPVTGKLSHKLEIALEEPKTSFELNPDRFSLASFLESENSSSDLFDRVHEFAVFHNDWVKSKKYAYQNTRIDSKGPRITLKRTRRGGRSDYLSMGSNDYLGLGAHPEVVEAAKQALDTYGFGSTGSPVTTGLTDLHRELCARVAKMHQKEAAILFNSGYTANIGVITALCGPNDLIVADQLCHASIQDGMQMSKGTSRFFKHNSPEHLRQILEKERANYNGALIITEGVFSMDGDVAVLDQIYRVAREYGCRIMVDQAHDFGVVGPNGLGVCEKYNLLREVDIIMGTFSKIGGAIGGFITGSQELIDWLRSFSRAQIFSVSLPPSNVAAVMKALEIFQRDRSILRDLHRNIKHFIEGLRSIGYEFNPNHESAVIPVVIGDERVMGDMLQSLMDDGVLCSPVVYPAVSRKNCRFRFTIMANHTVSDLDYAISCLEKAAIKSNFKFQPIGEPVKKAA